MKEYDLDFLIKTFEEHQREYSKLNEDNPEIYFDLPKALLLICKEIKSIKDSANLNK